MHVERRGGPPNLPEAFERFVVGSLKGRVLDDKKNEEAKLGKFPDFACFRDLVLIEMKHFEAEQRDRVNSIYKKNVDPAEEPLFFGTRRMGFDAFSNGEQITAAVLNRLSQTIETQLRKANRQFEEYRSRNPRKNSVCICLFLNSRLNEFSPEIVTHSVQRKMKAGDGEARFPYIDAVIYITEKHVRAFPDGHPVFPICVLLGRSIVEQCWKAEFVDTIARRWSEFRTGSSPGRLPLGDGDSSDIVEDVPERMRRSDFWRLEYGRNPYLQNLSVERLKVYFNRCLAINSLSYVIGSWKQPTQEEMEAGLRRFSHAIEEINRRGLDMREFSPKLLSPTQLNEVYHGLPAELRPTF